MEIKENIDFEETVKKAIDRTCRIGAYFENETIYLLEKEIDSYRETIKLLKCALTEREERLQIYEKAQEKTLEVKLSELPIITINIENMSNTFYPESFLKDEQDEI